MLLQHTQGVIDEAAIAIDVFDRVLMREQLNLIDAKHLGKQFDEQVFRKTAQRLPFAGWHGLHDASQCTTVRYFLVLITSCLAMFTPCLPAATRSVRSRVAGSRENVAGPG